MFLCLCAGANIARYCPPSKFPRFYLCTRNSATKMSSHKAAPFGSADTQKASPWLVKCVGVLTQGDHFVKLMLVLSLFFFFNIRDTYTVWFPPFCTHSIFCALFCNLQNNILYNGVYLAEQHMLSGSHPFFSTALHPMDPSEENVVLHSRTSYASILVSYSLTSYGTIRGLWSIP